MNLPQSRLSELESILALLGLKVTVLYSVTLGYSARFGDNVMFLGTTFPTAKRKAEWLVEKQRSYQSGG